MNTRHASMLVVAIVFGPAAVAKVPDPPLRAVAVLDAPAQQGAQLRAASSNGGQEAVTPAVAASPATAFKDRADLAPCPATTFVASLWPQPALEHLDAEHVNALRRVSATAGPSVEPPSSQTEPGNLGLLLAAFGLAATILYRRLRMLVPKDLSQ